MRHLSDATVGSLPYFRLRGNELESCTFMMNARITTTQSQGSGGFFLRIDTGNDVTQPPDYHMHNFRKSVPQSFGNCREMTVSIGGFVKDATVHFCALFASSSVSAPAASLPHNVYEIEGTLPIDVGSDYVQIAIGGNGIGLDGTISGVIV